MSNEVRLHVFANRVHTLYSKGRGKLPNLIIVDPTNCGKNFLLFPREIIFKTFLDPANEKYGCVGATTVELIVLNCFCCSNELNKWNYFLLLLKGHAVHLPTQKNHSTSDICIDKDRHFFVTSKDVTKFIHKYTIMDDIENDMMAVRLDVFNFTKTIAFDKQNDAVPCGKRFATLIQLAS